MRTPTEEHVAAVKHDIGIMAGALYRIAQGVENPQDAAYEALCAVGADDLARLARSAVKEAPNE